VYVYVYVYATYLPKLPAVGEDIVLLLIPPIPTEFFCEAYIGNPAFMDEVFLLSERPNFLAASDEIDICIVTIPVCVCRCGCVFT
jgi:hypothetical protein